MNTSEGQLLHSLRAIIPNDLYLGNGGIMSPNLWIPSKIYPPVTGDPGK
jgi:hypothetical protein